MWPLAGAFALLDVVCCRKIHEVNVTIRSRAHVRLQTFSTQRAGDECWHCACMWRTRDSSQKDLTTWDGAVLPGRRHDSRDGVGERAGNTSCAINLVVLPPGQGAHCSLPAGAPVTTKGEFFLGTAHLQSRHQGVRAARADSSPLTAIRDYGSPASQY